MNPNMPYPDWAAARFANYAKEHVQYTPVQDYAKYTEIVNSRIKEREEGHHLITFIGSSIDQILAALPEYRSVHFERAYAYNEGLVALDVIYTLSKKQAQSTLGPSVVEKMVEYVTWESCKKRNHAFDGYDWNNLRQLKVAGYVFAQTYTKHTTLAEAVMEGCPVPLNTAQLGWEPNITDEDENGFYCLDGAYNFQIWRSQFVPTRAMKMAEGLGKAKFALDLIPKALDLERLEERMHANCSHPDWEYAKTHAPKGTLPHQPEGYFWRENITANGTQTAVLAQQVDETGPEISMHEWRRPRSRPIFDTQHCWMEPGAEVKFLNKKQFGEMFGPFLPKNMAGLDFTSGYVASVSWIGTVKVAFRHRNPETGEISPPTEEINWEDDQTLPLRVPEIFRAIANFKQAQADKEVPIVDAAKGE